MTRHTHPLVVTYGVPGCPACARLIAEKRPALCPAPSARRSDAVLGGLQANRFGRYAVERWGTAWVVMRDRDDGARIVVTTPFQIRREAREWAAHLDSNERTLLPAPLPPSRRLEP